MRNPGEPSELDLAVLCEPAPGLERTRVMDRLARKIGVDVDVIELASASATLAWQVIPTGRLLVERHPLAAERFVRQTRFDAEDEARRHRMVALAQAERIGSQDG